MFYYTMVFVVTYCCLLYWVAHTTLEDYLRTGNYRHARKNYVLHSLGCIATSVALLPVSVVLLVCLFPTGILLVLYASIQALRSLKRDKLAWSDTPNPQSV